MKWVVLLGRLFFAAIFLLAAPEHFTSNTVHYAAAQGVPLAKIAVPLSGVIALAGAASIVLGFRAKIGGWLLVLFLVPVTLMMHNFWADKNAQMAMVQQIMFMKNLSMLGGAMMIAYFGSGPLSVDNLLKKRPAAKAS